MDRKPLTLQIFRAFYYHNFSCVFITSVLSSAGRYMMLVALGWLVLDITDSAFSLGLVWAIYGVPSLIFGILAGVIADKFDRRRLLIGVFVISAAGAFLLGIITTKNWIQLWHILFICFIMGSTLTFGLPARQAFVVDIVGSENTMNAISINAVGSRIVGLFGGTVAGVVIETLGIQWCFYIMVMIYLSAGLILLFGAREVVRKVNPEQQSIRESFINTVKLISKNQIVLILAVMAVICEIFGFSFSVVLPIFARDILAVGAIGLGTFYTAESLGGLLGGLALASLGNYKYKGWLILSIFLSFGILLVLFSQSSWYLVSLLFIGMVGVVSSAMDAMGHTILQLNVADEQRGRVMGIWMMSIGFGPVGHIMIGTVAALLGAQLAVSINGILMIVIFSLLIAFVPRLRKV